MEARYLTDLEWRICHAVNIYVYRNGRDGEQPILVHIPPAKKKNMKSVLGAIQERVKYPVGYAAHLYKMDGKKIRHPCELEVYNNYVVASNYDKSFKCAQYGRKKSPLLVLNRDSKHVRVLRLQNQNYHEWILKKKAVGEERPQFIYPTYYTSENARAQDLDVKQVGNFVPPGAGGACCQSNGEKTFRVGQEKHKNHPESDFVVNACVTTNTRNPDTTLMKKQEFALKKQPLKVGSEGFQQRPPRKGQLSTKFGVQPLELRKSDILNANVIVNMTDEEMLEDVTESDLPCSGRKETCNTNTTEDTSTTTTSEDTLDRKYEDMIKKLKKARNRRRRNNDINDDRNNVEKETTSRKSNPKGTTTVGTHNGKQILVLPLPPPQFRDEKGFLPEINGGNNNSAWKSTNCNKPMADSPFVLSDGQLRPQPRHPFHNRTENYPLIQSLQASGFFRPMNPGDGVKTGTISYPFVGQGFHGGNPVGPGSGQGQQSARSFPPNMMGQPVFGPCMLQNGFIQQPQSRSIPSETRSGYTQSFTYPATVGFSNAGTQSSLYGHPDMPPQVFMGAEGYGSYQVPQFQPYLPSPRGMETGGYNLGSTMLTNSFTRKIHGTREERSDAEVDIPYTPMIHASRTCRAKENVGMDTGRRRESFRKVEVDPVKSRNVAIQMGHPGQDMTESSTTSHSQHSNPQRPQMIPVKVAYYTTNGESHLDDAFLLQDEMKEILSTRKDRDLQKHQSIGTKPQVLTSRINPKTSNASTQFNRMSNPSEQYIPNTISKHETGKEEHGNLPRHEPHLQSNQSFVEYFISGAQEANSEHMIGDLTLIPPPTEFQEAMRSPQYRSFQNVPHHFDRSPRPDLYF